MLDTAEGWNWLAGLAGPAPAPASQFSPAEQTDGYWMIYVISAEPKKRILGHIQHLRVGYIKNYMSRKPK